MRMSDSERNISGTSSALLNIASAYSDSDSSQENRDDTKPRKSLGSLVEDLRAEAKRAEYEALKLNDEQERGGSVHMSNTSDWDKSTCVTKIVRLDSGKVVKLSTSSGTKTSDIRHLEPESKSFSTSDLFDIKVHNRDLQTSLARDEVQECSVFSSKVNRVSVIQNDSTKAVAVSEERDVVLESQLNEPYSIKKTIKTDIDLDNDRQTNRSVKQCTGIKSDVSSNVVRSHTSEITESGISNRENLRISVTENANQVCDQVVEDGVQEKEAFETEVIMLEVSQEINYNVDPRRGSNENSQILEKSNSKHPNIRYAIQDSFSPGSCNDNVRELSSNAEDDVQVLPPRDALNHIQSKELWKSEEESQSKIVDFNMKSKQEESTLEVNLRNHEELNNDITIESENIRTKPQEESELNIYEKAPETVGKLTFTGNSEKGMEKKPLEVNAELFNKALAVSTTSEQGRKEMSEGGDARQKHEPKPLPKLERIKLKSSVAFMDSSAAKAKEINLSPSTQFKTADAGENHHQSTMPDPRKTGRSPVKLKRNFSCISTASNEHTEKKFRPDPPIETTRSTLGSGITTKPSEPEISIVPQEATPSKICLSEVTITKQQEEQVKSPPRMEIPSIGRSSALSHVPPQQSFQPSFTNVINSSQNQVPIVQPLKNSPPQLPPRAARREDQRRTLPLILRKAEVSGPRRGRTPAKSEDSLERLSPKREDANSDCSSKIIAESDVSVEPIFSESQEKSASVPSSNSSSNQENTNFGTKVDFENMIGSAVVCKESKMPVPEDSSSDNAQPAPPKDEEPKHPTSFLSQPVPPMEMPTIIIPKKRGRPRKFPLPETGTLVGTWPMMDKNGKPASKTTRRRRCTKKFRPEGEGTDDDDTPRKRYIPRYKKKRKPGGEDSDSSKSFNKKGRMEVLTEGCKPVTVHQITEYFWPPISSLSPGEKPEGLMIQEQISEYLGVKSFKRKYPSIKRRPVDMEERNYLQENGYVSENMCDMGLTAVYSSDIIEIMYNDFPQKFEEYRKYAREKKIKEQKALREKQAAESMDPRKEALESAVSWNTEFNKIFQIPYKMEKPKRCYNYQVLLGEWYERKCDEEFKLAMYLKRKERGGLLISKVRRLFTNMLKDIQLSLPTAGLAHGGIIQLMAPDVPGYPPWETRGTNMGVVLAVTVEPDDVDSKQDFEDNLLVVGSPICTPCVRNSFSIEPEDTRKRGQPLCFGDVFSLKCAATTETPLYIAAPVLSPFTTVGKCGFPVPRLCLHKSFEARFKVLPLDDRSRVELDGYPVKPFDKILLIHAPANLPVCVESLHWQYSLFSAECEISVRSTLDIRKEYGPPNKWMFIVGTLK